ncbi:ankyrin repeat-containing domain protein, partial [Cyathus striatus]
MNAKTLLSLSDSIINLKNSHDQTPLHWAASAGLTDIVLKVLDLVEKNSLDAYVNAMDKNGLLAIHYAAQAGYISIVRKLLTLMDIDNIVNNWKLTKSPLYLAYQNQRHEVVKLLMP